MVRTTQAQRSWILWGVSWALLSGCSARVENGENLDDAAAEIDETSAKEDGVARPRGRFEVSDFDSYEAMGTLLDYTYALELNDPSRVSAREFGANEEAARMIRREVSLKFTRSGSKRYIRLTDTNPTTSPPEVVRFEYSLEGDRLGLRRVNTSAWFYLVRVPDASEPLVEALHSFAADGALQEVGDTGDYMGALPFRVQLNVTYLHSIYGTENDYGVHAFDFAVYDPGIDTTRPAFELMVPVGRDIKYFFYTAEGQFIDRATLHGEEMRWGE